MTFLNPIALLLLIPLFFIFKNRLLSKDEFLLNSQIFNKQTKLLIIILVLTIVSLSRPALENTLSKEKFDANEYIIALDASFSMQADDLKPTRYQVAKKNIISFLNFDKKNRFSIFAFTTNPLLICPPTTDTQIALSALEALVPKYILTKGTSLETLLTFIAKLPQDKKNLIIFTDGGEEHQLNSLISIAKKSAITIHIVATASKKGVALKNSSTHLRDSNSNLVISRVNPILKELAYKTGGNFIHITNKTQDVSEELYSILNNKAIKDKSIQTDIISYKELYYYPLLLSFILLILSLTKMQKFIPFFSLLIIFALPTKSDASVLDFYYLKEATKAYKEKDFNKAISEYKKLSPSVFSYLNLATSYYKAKKYSNAMKYYALIQSTNPKIKQIIFYNMGNCAVKLQKYNRAKTYYQQALALGYDKASYENLITLYKLNIKSKINVADMLPKPDAKEKKNSSKKTDKQKDDNKSDNKNKNSKTSKSNQRALTASSGAGEMNKSKNKIDSSKIKDSKNQYQMGYKAYELINKGYTNESNPW